jgi:serine/threonine-protein kinase
LKNTTMLQPTTVPAGALLEALIKRFELAWQAGARPSIEQYLSDAPLDRTLVLRELVHADLEYRLRAGDAARVEEYLERFPELLADTGELIELVAAEYRYRQHLNQQPTASEFVERFPQYGEALKSILQGGTRETVETVATPGRAPRQPLPESEGRYRVEGEVARGGMGVVYKARDTVLGRVVALKAIRSGTLANAEEVERFYREARAVAQLKHRHIISVYDFGQMQDQLYFTMELAERGSVAHHLDRLRQDVRAAVVLLEKVARAVQCIHEHGLLHRDLKPANILLGQGDEPLVSDFGLAKDVAGTSEELTRTGLQPGTPAYMAPEQAMAESRQIGPGTDIWALGVILYEVLCGRRPFAGTSADAVKSAIVQTDPARPRSLQPRLDRALETIILKCLEKDPARRYPSAGALADDLGCWLRGEPIKAQPVDWLRRLGRWTRHRPKRVAAVAVLLLACVAVPVVLHQMDPDRPLKSEILPRLKRQESVVLIGSHGPPRWFAWRLPGTVASTTPDAVFSIHSGAMSLLELLPEPGMERYRLRAEVRQEASSPNGDVGLYLSYSKHQLPAGEVHCFLALRFADWGSRARDDKGKPDARLTLAMVHHCQSPSGIVFNRESQLDPQKAFAPFYLSRTVGWRQLTLEVTPERVDVFWGDREKVGSLTRAARLEAAGKMLRKRPDMQAVNPEFSPTQALGLFVDQSAASFRNVVIEPLDAD